MLLADMGTNSAKDKAGYKKIRETCKQACDDCLDFVWIDTCCIDQNSSAELSEAINSMYSWYQRAAICYGYELIRSRACLGQDIGSINWREFQLITMITFKISIIPRHLAGALLFQSVGGGKFVILLGSTTELGVGFDVVPLSNIENVEELRSSFIPRAAGTRMILGNHQVQVNAEPQRITAKRCFMVDIFIQAISVSKDPTDAKTLLTKLEGSFDKLQALSKSGRKTNPS